MSIVRCEDCNHQIDTDQDVDCEVYVGNYRRLHATKMLCAECREAWLQDAADYERDAQLMMEMEIQP